MVLGSGLGGYADTLESYQICNNGMEEMSFVIEHYLSSAAEICPKEDI